jgi:hypothetical protein
MKGMGVGYFLQINGLTNTQTPDIGMLVGENRDVIGTYCSSFKCGQVIEYSKHGPLVAVGAKEVCPVCKSAEALFYKKISCHKAAIFLEKEKS